MSGLFNTYFYGKAGQGDFTPDQMPKNRLELFFTAVKGQFGKLISLNLLYVVFCIPMIFWIALNAMVIMNQYVSDAGTVAEVNSFVNDGYFAMFIIGMVPCLTLAGIGSTGQMYVLRNWARDQHSFMMSDFKDSIKTNWKQGLLLGFINGMSLLILAVCWMFYGQLAQSNVLFLIPQALVAVLTVVWWMMNMLTYPMIVTYEMRFRDVLRNCALIAVARLPWSVLFLLLTFVLPIALVLLIPYVLCLVIVVLYYLIIGFSITGLIYASYATACFDKYLNPRIEGAKVRVGMRDPSMDALDEADEEEVRKEIESMK